MPTMSATSDDGMMTLHGYCDDEMDYHCISDHAYNISLAFLKAGGRHLDTGNHYKT